MTETTNVSNLECGTATPSKYVKNRFYKEGKRLSLKEFARKLVADGDEAAKNWFEYKSGALNEKRSDKNNARVDLERAAKRQSKGKK